MANRYLTFREDDLGAGIDQQSAENKILPGYAEDIENMDPKSTGQVRTRRGYQGYAGYVPIRVKKIAYTDDATDNLCLFLDGSVDLTNIASSPVIVTGKTSSQNTSNAGDFPNDSTNIKYYSGFTKQIKKTLLTGTNTLVITADEHTFSTDKLFVGLTESTSVTDNDNSIVKPDSIEIDSSTFSVTITYTNNTGANIDSFVYIADRSTISGSNFVSSSTVISTGSATYTITSATHGLSSFNIVPAAYEDTGTSLVLIEPDEVRILSNGNVEIDITNDTGSTFNAIFLLSDAGATNISTGSVAANSTATVVISNITTDFLFVAPYLETTIGGTLEFVMPDSIVIDSSAQTATVTFVNGSSSGKNFEVYYQFAQTQTNKLCLTGSIILTAEEFTDTAPQLTLYGIPHSELYGTERSDREGWVNHIDSYRSAGEDRLVCGLGGNLFSATLFSESTSLLFPTLYPNIRGRVASDTTVGPVFIDTTDTSSRTRGYIQSSDAGNNFLSITAATYQSGSDTVRYRISAPDLAISGTLSTIIDTTTGTEDRLTVQQMGNSRLNGTFKIKAVTAGADYLDIDTENSSISSSDYDEVDAGGFAGIFTDRLILTTTSVFLEDDVVGSALFSNYTVTGNSGSTVLFSNVTSEVEIPGGLRIVGTRTASVMPVRDLNGTSTVENAVRGDMFNFTGLTRQLRARYINANSDSSLTSISGDGAVVTIILASGDTTGFSLGQKILIRGSSNYNGEHTITAIPSLTSLSFASTLTTTETGTLVGKTIELDETLSIEDTVNSSNKFTLFGRWSPIEAPEDSFDLTPSTIISHFDSLDYTNQNILRSVMVQDNLYLTNNNDEVMKFDGTNIYRAGLFRWQPHLFVTTDTTATGVIVLENPSISYSASSANRFTVNTEDRLTFPVGTKIEDSIDNERYIVIDTLDDGANAHIIVDREIQSTYSPTPNLTKVSTRRYYFRLNAVDANNNLIASAVTGADDFVVELAADAAVRIRLVGMPAWDVYDYDRLEVQIYATQFDQSGPFFRLTTLPMSFNNTDGYLDYIDTDTDEDLRDLDQINTALLGAELGQGFSEPLRAKYCTSADNRLILSNLTDYPTINLNIVQNNTGPITISDFLTSGNSRYLFRIDNTDAGTTTDMLTRVAYEFVDSTSSVTITPASDITSPASNTVNINSVAHGLSVGDWVYLYHSSVADANLLTFAGWFMVSSVPDADNFRFLTTDAAAGTANDVDRYITATSPADVPVFLGTDGNYAMLNGNRGSSESYEFLAIRRLANAINASMRKVDITVSGFETFSPWLIGNAGNEFNIGQLVIKQPKVLSTSLELQLPALTGVFDVFANNIKRSAGSSAGAVERLFPSRTIISFPGFPEIFDSPTVDSDVDSLSAIDVNSADGQEITANIPFFGHSAFGGAQQDSIIVVFKENSIYLLNTAAKAAGAQPLQKIESEGKGCTAPFSVAVTKSGIMFANFAGIYRLGRDNQIDYVGRKYERIWREEVNRDLLAIATGHHFSNGNQYKLSLPVGTSQTENNEVAVYNHTREYTGQGPGGWATYTNHAATGWANLLDDSYFSTVDGQVFSIRRAFNNTDYRDDASPISWKYLTRAMDFGDPAIRKTFGWVISHYRALASDTSITLKAGADLVDQLEATDDFDIILPPVSDGLSDSIQKKVVTIKSSLSTRIGNYLQLQYSGEELDTPAELAGFEVRVAGKSSKGVGEAAETTT